MNRSMEIEKISEEFLASHIYSGAKKDCFGYSNINNRCSVLTETVCKNGICKFYKTKKEFEKGRNQER